jgi:hypothetical protein
VEGRVADSPVLQAAMRALKMQRVFDACHESAFQGTSLKLEA